MARMTFWELVRNFAIGYGDEMDFSEMVDDNVNEIQKMSYSKRTKALRNDKGELTVRQHLCTSEIAKFLWTLILLGLPTYKDDQRYTDFRDLDLAELETTDSLSFDEADLQEFLRSHDLPLPETMFMSDSSSEECDLTDTTEEAAAQSISARPENYFMRRGDHWEIGFEARTTTIRDLAGVRYITYLLESTGQGRSISCVELSHIYKPAEGATFSDDEVRAEGLYEAVGVSQEREPEELERLGRYLQELMTEKDCAVTDREREFLQNEIDEVVSAIKGIKKRDIDPNFKKAQSAVTKALERVYHRLDAILPNLSQHLQDHIRPDGKYGLVYTGNLSWKIHA